MRAGVLPTPQRGEAFHPAGCPGHRPAHRAQRRRPPVRVAPGTGVDEADRLLSIIEQRCVLHRNGASWYVAKVKAHEKAGADRAEALRLTLQDYRLLMHANEPVHTWPL